MQRWSPILTALACLVLSSCNHSSVVDASDFNEADWERQISRPSLSETEFTLLYARRASAKLRGAEVKIAGERALIIKLADGEQLNAFLDNAWKEAAGDPTNRPEIVRRYVSAILDARNTQWTSDDLVTNRIVAVIRDDAFVLELNKLSSGETNRIVIELFVAELKIVYAVDHKGGISYLSEGRRKELNLELGALRRTAITNLQRLLGQLNRGGKGPVFMIVGDGNYESSLLLAEKFWDRQAQAVEGDIVAAVPARHLLFFTGSKSADGIRRLREAVDKAYSQESHPVSKTLLVRRNSEWERFSD